MVVVGSKLYVVLKRVLEQNLVFLHNIGKHVNVSTVNWSIYENVMSWLFPELKMNTSSETDLVYGKSDKCVHENQGDQTSSRMRH